MINLFSRSSSNSIEFNRKRKLYTAHNVIICQLTKTQVEGTLMLTYTSLSSFFQAEKRFNLIF